MLTKLKNHLIIYYCKYVDGSSIFSEIIIKSIFEVASVDFAPNGSRYRVPNSNSIDEKQSC